MIRLRSLLMTKRISGMDIFLALLVVLLLGALLAFVYLGHFTRYMADDYCTAAYANSAGFYKPQIESYRDWTGRFSFSFLLAVAELIGPSIVPFLPLFALTCWLAASVWSIYQIATVAQWPRAFLVSAILAELIIFATLNSAHHIVQSFYWQTGLLTYTAPLIFMTLYVGVVVYGAKRRLQMRSIWILVIASFAITFFAGGFSETYVVMQTCCLLLPALAVFKLFRRSLWVSLPFTVAGLAGSLMSVAVVVAAPGNKIRQSFFPPPPDLINLTKLSIHYTVRFVGRTVYQSPLTLVGLLLVPMVIAHYLFRLNRQRPGPDIRMTRILLVSLPLVSLFLIFISFVPGVYGTSGDPAWRTRIIPQFVLAFTMVGWSFLAGLALSPRLSTSRYASWIRTASLTAVIVLAISSPVLSIRRIFKLVPLARASANLWDQSDRELRAAKAQGLRDVTIPAVDDVESRLGAPFDELEIDHNAKNWKNQCVANYYGLNSIRAR